jgi:putative DNA primase/helicase
MDEIYDKKLDEAIAESRASNFKLLFADPETKQKASYDIATFLMRKHNVKSIGGEKVREVYVYKDGVYVDGANILRYELRELLEELCTTYYTKEIIEAMKDRTSMRRSEFKADVNLLNLNNGIFDIKTRKLLPHEPQYLFFTKLPVDYKEGADCPNTKKFLSDTLEDEAIPIIQEWLGFGLYRSYFIKKASIYVGEADTGKTTLIKLFKALFGLTNVSGVSLQKISSDKFATAYFHNKHINIYDDLQYKDIKDNGNFKMITGGDSIPGEYKFGNQFLFENYAKLMFACNKIPDVKDANDDAYFDRWIVVRFNNVVDKTQIDPFLVEKLTTPDELSGLLNFALEGLGRLLQNKRFSYEKDADEIKAEMQRSGSPIASFAYDCLMEVVKEWTTKEQAYAAYAQYARSHKLPILTMQKVGRDLPKYAPYVSEGKPVDPKQNKQVTAWMNVRLKPGIEVDLLTKKEQEHEQSQLGIGAS